MFNKYQLEQMFQESLENVNRLTKMSDALWEEISKKNDRMGDLKYEVYELKTERDELLEKLRDCSKKQNQINNARTEKGLAEYLGNRRTDN
tara:strand:+ start:189 stop:461 length:273 start_codon:yes stop_codon:yes gene_type:complete